MFTAEYVESADPLVNLIQTDPSAVFAEPHMAYLIVLFGEADRETTEWIRANLRALDSLLGPDIAGVIFVKSFKIRALIRTHRTIGYSIKRVIDNQVDLSEIRQVEEISSTAPMFCRDGNITREASRYVEDLTAITYASDEVARSLGLLGELPCIALLDTLPGPIRCLPLDAGSLPDSIKLIRRIVARLMAAPSYDESRTLLRSAHKTGERIGHLMRASKQNELQQRELLRKRENPLIEELRVAQMHLSRGSVKRFQDKLRQSSLTNDLREAALLRASTYAPSMDNICTAIRAVSSFTQAEWPLSELDRDRLVAILSGDVAESLDLNGTNSEQLTKELLQEKLDLLNKYKAHLVMNVWGDLPAIDDLEKNIDAYLSCATQRFREKQEIITDELAQSSAQLENLLRELDRAPRITDAFDDVVNSDSRNRLNNLELGPEFTEKLLKSVTNGAVRISGNDIYIGTNIAAMGPYAKAEGTTFSGGGI